jgi:hypothetical protein
MWDDEEDALFWWLDVVYNKTSLCGKFIMLILEVNLTWYVCLRLSVRVCVFGECRHLFNNSNSKSWNNKQIAILLFISLRHSSMKKMK